MLACAGPAVTAGLLAQLSMQKALDAPLVEVREEINRHVSAPTWGPRRACGIMSCKRCGRIRRAATRMMRAVTMRGRKNSPAWIIFADVRARSWQ
jgi:hypothetical protein